MLQREKNPNLRKYITHLSKSTTVSTSLHRATNILSCLSNDINTATDIASYCKYSTSTVHRLLQTLKELNWAIQDDNNHKYYLGPLVYQLSSNQIAAHKYLIMRALHEMIHLSNITEESKRLGPLFIGATAKVLLSQLSNEELRTTMKHIKFDRVTENTVTDKEVLMAQLKEIRQQGYCVTYSERIPGAICISAPVKNYICPATLSIIGPENRLRPRVNRVIEELKASASRIPNDIAGAFN